MPRTKPHEDPLCRCEPCRLWLGRDVPPHNEITCQAHVIEAAPLGCDDLRCVYCWHRLWGPELQGAGVHAP